MKKLSVPRNIGAATELKVDCVYAVSVDDDEVFVALLEGVTKATRCVTELDSQAQFSKCHVSKKQPVPFLRERYQPKNDIMNSNVPYLYNMKRTLAVVADDACLTPECPMSAILASILRKRRVASCAR